MKKTYQNPETNIVKVQMAQMIAASDQQPQGFNGTLGTESEGGDGSGALSRRGGLWDDDED